MKQALVAGILIGFVFLQSCSKADDPVCTKEVSADVIARVEKDKLAEDIVKIDAYLASKGITALSEPNGVRYVINKQGTGVTIFCLENKIKVKYKGSLLVSGNQFDSNSTGVTFTLSGSIILGWKLVMPKIQTGSTVTLYIPSGFCYGAFVAADGKIPANSNLIFEIELLEIL